LQARLVVTIFFSFPVFVSLFRFSIFHFRFSIFHFRFSIFHFRFSMQERVLVYRIGQLGDSLVALPALWAIREHFAKAHLTLLTNRYTSKSYVSVSDLLPEGALFDQVMFYEAGSTGTGAGSALELLPKLRRARFDTLVYLAPRRRTRREVWRDLAFFRLAGVTRFYAHRGFAPFPPRTSGSPLPLVEYEADHLLSRLALSGISIPPPNERRIDLKLSQAELDQARAWLASNAAGLSGRGLLALGPGSNSPSRIWPQARFEELGRRLLSEFGLFPVVVGGRELSVLGDALVAAWGCGANAAAKLSLRESAALLALCTLYVGNETGTTHLAAAVGARCVAIFSAVEWPGRWHPYGGRTTVLRRAVPCEGCRLDVCVDHDMACLKAISVEDALAACRATLTRGGT